ncbi:MAG: hypothetical protein Q8O99_01690 [bacterium]|nr:hypothetical protein [bacterium]
MKQIALLSFFILVVVVLSGCLKKPTPTESDTDTSSIQQTGADVGTTDEIEVLETGDFQDPEVEEIIGLLEDMVAEEGTGTNAPAGSVQNQEVGD